MNPQPHPPTPTSTASLTRRQFLAATGAAASFTLLDPRLVGGTTANSKINLGLVGCGGRGKWLTNLFVRHGGYNVVAVADYFHDRADEGGEKFHVPAAKRFTGLHAYLRLLDAGVDAVAVISPPFFHPIQARAGMEAGKHVYLAKPIAVDVPGCQTVLDAGRLATLKKQVFLVDFQTRAHEAYQTAVKKVQAGAIGQLVSGEALYYCDTYFARMDAAYRKHLGEPEARLRAWAVDRILSGDIITEQDIHALDVATWFLDAAPLKAYGAGGRARPFIGNCWDHFSVVYYFPNNVLVSFTSKQVGKYWNDIICRMYGMTGTVDTHYSGKVDVLSDDPYHGSTPNLYEVGAVNNIATFYRSITEGDYRNPTVEPSVRSTRTTILGRMAAYGQREVTWTEMMSLAERYEYDTRGLKV